MTTIEGLTATFRGLRAVIRCDSNGHTEPIAGSLEAERSPIPVEIVAYPSLCEVDSGVETSLKA
jgi:hypothetical protein